MVSRVDQILPCYASHDAIGNHVRELQALLRDRGFVSEIFAHESHAPGAHLLDTYRDGLVDDCIAIYHMAVGSRATAFFRQRSCFRVCSYHNITPPEFFSLPEMFEPRFYCELGRHQLAGLRNIAHMTWSVSEYNRRELEALEFRGPHCVFPVLRHYDRLVNAPQDTALASHLRGRLNVVFVGRVMPHKGHLDLLFVAQVMRHVFRLRPRWIFVGSGPESYVRRLRDAATGMDLSWASSLADADADVVFAEDLSDNAMAQVYRACDLFLCLSEHEGFCVPLVEAMFFGCPIVAHRGTAVPETVGSHGLLVDKFDTRALVDTVRSLLLDAEARRQWAGRARTGAERFTWPSLVGKFESAFAATLEEQKRWIQEKRGSGAGHAEFRLSPGVAL